VRPIISSVRSLATDSPLPPARLLVRFVSACAERRAAAGSERGSLLIEVMVGAVLVAIVSIAIFNGLDGAQATGAKNKARSVQATLAQQDIERMRSIPVTALANLNQSRTVTVARVDYTVVSRTEWVRDSGGVVTCSNDEARADYLKLTSTVTSPATTGSPVIQTGLLTPSLGQLSQSLGTATVRLTGRDGEPKAGVTVTLTGPSSVSVTTNDLGCAVFGYIASGTYTAQVPGHVDMTSDPPAREPLVVYPGKASFGHMEVERPASLRARFVAPVGNVLAPASALAWDKITVKNVNLPGGSKLFTRASRSTTVDATDLFPYTNGVGVYAGSCPANDPSAYRADYFQSSGFGFTPLDPGDTLRSVDVQMPTLRVNVMRQNTGTWDRTQLLVTSLDSGCTVEVHRFTDDHADTTGPYVADLAMPFGRYRICAHTRGRTSATDNRRIDRRYTTTATAGSNPVNPADQDMTTVPPVTNRAIVITTPSASSADGTCF
jgi:Tfp pilus assembly protein PilV